MATQKSVFHISGMTCTHCEKRVAKAARRIAGVFTADASFPKKRVTITYDDQIASEAAIKKEIENEGYAVRTGGQKQSFAKVIPVFLIILAVYFVLKYTIGLDFFNLIPKIDTTVSFIALFSVGLLTSVHCIAMCGGINLSQSVGREDGEKSRIRKPLLYNLGRVVSYTAIGALVGGLGSVLFISVTVKGIIMLAAAVFMILMGLSMLGWLPSWLVPRMPGKILVDANKAKAGKGPFVVG
ncbi:MAG: sulfite exporter TauE/SafE family protein, partial [Eubacteriales bacterium]